MESSALAVPINAICCIRSAIFGVARQTTARFEFVELWPATFVFNEAFEAQEIMMPVLDDKIRRS